ncbi:Glycine-rich RNA-binding protein 3, mitochondrial [Ananas comosus]|uniref:Glycine-rich RNA-binding protein 3, mitochondrial n=1 Tax=Ananas comosus TaxID=4615 RepID=A0A199V042_ANACO|nr:Glycine-rich RNA-binding protein 3, mitochondrial [Ananas comosus]
MAFARKIGNLVKQTITSNPSLYQAVRCMSSSKIFVGGLSYGTDDQGLREAFTSFGEVIEARVIMDRETGRSRGFGFVTFTSSEEASTAISGMDSKVVHPAVCLLWITESLHHNIASGSGGNDNLAGGAFSDSYSGISGAHESGGNSATDYGTGFNQQDNANAFQNPSSYGNTSQENQLDGKYKDDSDEPGYANKQS